MLRDGSTRIPAVYEMTLSESKTIAVIPAFDEEVTIGSVVLKAKLHVDEVLVIDDGSTDRTADVARLAGANVISHQTNRGKGAALRTGLNYLRTKGCEAAVFIDGDGQHNPDDIPRILEPVMKGESDLVVGLRYRGNTAMPLYRRIGKRALDYATAASGGGAVTDSQNGFRALSKVAIDRLALNEDGFAIESEMLVDAREKKLTVSEVAVSVRYDLAGHTKGPVLHGFGVIDEILRIVAVRHPLFFFGLPGVFLLICGILLAAYVMEIYNSTRTLVVGSGMLAVIFLLIGSLGLFAGVMLNVLPKAISHRADNGSNSLSK